MVHLVGFLRNMLSNLSKIVIRDLVTPFAGDNLPGLLHNLASNVVSKVIDKLGKKISGKRVAITGQGFIVFISIKI